jgi:hypothetical protein
VFVGNFGGAFTVAVMAAIVCTFGFSSPPTRSAWRSATSAKAARRLRRARCRRMLTPVHPRRAVQLDGLGRRRRRHDLDLGQRQGDRHVDADHAVLRHDLRAFDREHVPVPDGLLIGGKFSVMDYLVWNEIPTVLGNLVGGLAFTGLTLYATHLRTAPKRAHERLMADAD